LSPGETHVDTQLWPDQIATLADYFRALRRDPLRSRYISLHMEERDALVSALPLPIRCGA
jgi:hypothetical protein